MIVLEAEILASRFDYCPSLRAVSKDKGKRETGPLLIFPLLSELIRRAKPGEDDAGYPASLSILVHLSHSSASERDRDLDRHGGVHEGGTSDRSCRLPHDRAAPQAHCASPLGVPSPHISVWVGRLGSVVFLPCEILPSKKHRVESPGCSGRRDFAKAGQVVVNYNTRVLQNDIRTHVDIGAGANLYLIFYTLFSAIVGFLLGASDGLGEIHSVDAVHELSEQFSEAFMKYLHVPTKEKLGSFLYCMLLEDINHAFIRVALLVAM
ncbi:uncharacterized protein LOC116267861 [Nymphaea colorata]|nr:uncharacterized protein LOC116267861 [Nymphaea colorata]